MRAPLAPLAALRALAATQDGQFATRQAASRDVTGSALQALARRGEIARVRHGVWRFRAAPGAADAAVSAYLACWPHAVISHESAARHHGLARVAAPRSPVVTVARGLRLQPAGVTVHRTRSLARVDVIDVAGVRYTSLARTVCDLASANDVWETLAILDEAVALGASPRWIHQRSAALVNGRAGLVPLRQATAPDGAGTFRSWLERAAACIYRAGHLPEPEWNVPVHDAAGLIGIVDALWRQWWVISEKEGLRFHTAPRRRREDARRFNRLCDAGYAPRRFTWEDVVHRPIEVAATVLRALRAAGAELDPARLPRTIVLPERPFT
jgi:hypothetical protein